MRKSTQGEQILIVEDNEALARIIKQHLEEEGFSSHVCFDGESGMRAALGSGYALLILDITLPKHTGLEIVREIRANKIAVPVIIVTMDTASDTELQVYRSGANLYHSKPVNYKLLIEQVHSLLQLSPVKNTYQRNGLEINTDSRTVSLEGEPVDLTYKEYELLLALVTANGEALSRTELLNRTFKGVSEPEEASIDTLVSRLRRKISRPGHPDLIETVRGIGFRLGLEYAQRETA